MIENKNIPLTWCFVKHKDIAIINPKIGKEAFDDDYPVSFLPMASVEECSGKYNSSEIRQYGEVKKGYTYFISGDIIFAKITPCMENGKVALVNDLHNNIGFGSTEFHVSRLSDLTNKKYFFYFLIQQSTRRNAKRHMTGSAGQLRVPKGYFEEIKIPFPPLAEQHRIVDKIEELFSDLDDGIASLKKAQKQLKVYRQAVLKSAFEGKLTAKWREEQKQQGKLESADSLLEKIKAERERRYQEELDTWKANVQAWEANGKIGTRPGKPKEYKALTPILESEIASVENIPRNWQISRIGHVSLCLDSMRMPVNKKDRSKREGNIPYYGANGQVGWINDYLFDEPLVLVVEDETFVGREKPFSYRIQGKSWVNNHAHILKPENTINIGFLNYQLQYYPFTPLTTGTTGRRKLTQSALMEAPLKICSLSEQNQIVEEIESRLSICDSLKATITENLERAEALRQIILKQAFEGKLVPQDPNDEPASVLLERIRQAREQSEQLSQKSRKTKSKSTNPIK